MKQHQINMEIKVKERIPFPTRLLNFPSEKAFLCTAVGINMMPSISHGSRLICEVNSNPINGSIVIAKFDGRLECKYYRHIGTKEWLEDSNMKIIDKDFTIIGVVRQIISQV